jgi:nickel-dependent lactate racemase
VNEAGEAAGAWVFCGGRRLPVAGADGFEPPARLTPAEDPDWAVSCALAEPVASRPLGELAREALSRAPGDEVVIAVPDASRACPTPLIAGHLLAGLNAAGVPDDRVAVAVGCGLHATTSAAERRALLGGRVADRVGAFDTQGIEGPLTDLGVTAHGAPVLVHERVAAAALVIGVGIVEPHLYAGFSGGVKAVAIGCAGEPTIAWTHRPAFIGAPGVELGRLEGNPFQETLGEIAARTPLRYAVNAVVDEEGRPTALLAGDPARAQASLAGAHRAAWLRPVDGTCDVVVAGVPVPKSDNLYQASRAATYIGLQSRPALADGGTIVLCADLPRGAGDGPGERNFAALLAGARAPADVVARGLREPLGPGGQRAFVVARVLQRYRVAVVGARDGGWLEELGIDAFATVSDARAAAEARLGRRPRVLAVADALTTVVRQA